MVSDISEWKGEILRTQTRWRVKLNDENDWSIHGKYGDITVYPDGDLDIWIKNTHISNRIERDGWKAKNHHDDGAVFVRPYADLDKAAKYIKAGKKRQVTDAMREAGRRLAATRPILVPKPRLRGEIAS